MLRASSEQTGVPLDLRAVADSTIDPLTPLGPELLAFTDALVLRDTDELEPAREDLRLLGGENAVRGAAGVVATFEMMNRILDAIGAPISPRYMDTEISLAISGTGTPPSSSG